MSEPKVSIVIPVFNGSNYLREAIDSALSQTYSNIEVIVVNDGSTDDGKTEAIANSYGSRILYLFKPNAGVSSALNYGIKHMHSDWISWLSHDDYFSNNRVEEDLKFLAEHPDARVIFCRSNYLYHDGNIKETQYSVSEISYPGQIFMMHDINFCSITFHKSCLEKVGYFNEKNRTTQDIEMQLRLLKYYKFYFNENTSVTIREHSERGTFIQAQQHKKDEMLLADIILHEFSINEFFPNLNLEENFEMNDKVSSLLWMSYYVSENWGAPHAKYAYLRKALSFQSKNLIRQLGVLFEILFRFDIPVINRSSYNIGKLFKKIIRRIKNLYLSRL
ncbi:MAG: glycosyltransferase [Anaerolineaceae bacterium]|nr:glycosyltransferase [Anaerolineaceae bacterium]